MINITNKAHCTGCTACYNACKKKAISMHFDEYGQIYPSVALDLCNNCGLCEKVCPILHQDRFFNDNKTDSLEVKAIYNRDSETRKKSTSGGIFSLLAEYTINIGGVVCAVRFDDSYHIHHAFFERIDQIDPFRGSKYAQSDLGIIFSQIKDYLRYRPVLFVGTPCQVAGLKAYLVKEYNNLITCDFICMSISSGKMWDEYIANYRKEHKIKRVFFKDKRIGWHKTDWRMLIEDEQGEHLCKGGENPYFFAYLNRYSARPSCFSCVFRHCHHISDFTIADCWGIGSVYPDFDDNKGCTSLIIQSNKGSNIFEAIKDRTIFVDFGIQNVQRYNRHVEQQASMPKDYELFCENYLRHGFIYAANNAMRNHKNNSFFNRLKKIIKKLMNEI